MFISSILPALAFLLSIALVSGLRRLAPRIGLVDVPTTRKAHIGSVPLCGGIAMFFALLASVSLRAGLQGNGALGEWTAVPPHNPWPFVLGLGLLVAVGMADDRWEMGAIPKLALQILAAGLLLGLGAEMYLTTGSPLWPVSWPATRWMSLPVTLIFVVGVTNAFNMIDGLDGLAGSLASVALVGVALSGRLTGHPPLAEDGLLLLATVLGFLLFNLRRPGLPRAIAFMGDAGSMMLGCAIASMIVELASGSAAGNGPNIFPALLWLVAIPVIDTISLMIRRPLAGRSPMAADRTHLHHLLLDAGVSPTHATAILTGVSALLGVVGVSGVAFAIPASIMLAGLAIPVMAHCAFVWSCLYRQKATAQPQSLMVSSEPAE